MEDNGNVLTATINKAIISGILLLIICILGLYTGLNARKKYPSQSEGKPLRYNINTSTGMKPKDSEQLDIGAVETLISLINHSDLLESQRGNGVHIYLHTNSQSPVSQDIGFFRSNSGQQDPDLSKQYPDYRDIEIYRQDTKLPCPQRTDFKEIFVPLQQSRDKINLNDSIVARSNTDKIQMP